MPKIAYTKI